MNNITIGNSTEHNISDLFRKKGYWCYNCPKSKSGSQPFDLICLRKHTIWLIDGKHIKTDKVSFVLDRIEPNQWVSMKYASEYALIDIKNMGFGLEFERTGQLYWLPYKQALNALESGKNSININEVRLMEEIINENTD